MKPSNWCNLKQPVLVINCSDLCCRVKKNTETSQVLLESDMEALLCFICITVANFAVLVQPAVAQETNTTLPLTYSGQVLQGDGSQTCHSEAQRERVRNEVDNATLRLLQELVVPLLQDYSCGGSTGWRCAAYLNMSDSS